MSVLVLGATGNIGPHVVSALVEKGTRTRVITRNKAKAHAMLPSGTEILEGDIANGRDLMAAVDGAESIFLLTPHGYEMADVQLRIIRELRRSDVRIVKLSGTSSAIRPDGPHACRQHWETETILRGSGQPFVILRPNAFMQTLINQIMLPSIQATGRIPNALATSGVSLIDAHDIGAVSANVLTSNTWDGETVVLTGPRAVTYQEIADKVSEIRGQKIELLEITPEDVRVQMLQRGLEPWEAEHFQEMYQVFRDGESAFISDDVERVTGKAPRTVEEYLAEHAEAFRLPVAAG